MNKLEMAHDWAMKHGKADTIFNCDETVELAWDYADAMQAEADKRNQDSRSLTKDQEGNCLHFHHEFGHKKCMDCGASLDEWQPDWSQSPKHMNYFFMNKDGSKYWTVNKPDKPNLTEHVINFFECGGDCYSYASSQYYKGDWKDSLRERP